MPPPSNTGVRICVLQQGAAGAATLLLHMQWLTLTSALASAASLAASLAASSSVAATRTARSSASSAASRAACACSAATCTMAQQGQGRQRKEGLGRHQPFVSPLLSAHQSEYALCIVICLYHLLLRSRQLPAHLLIVRLQPIHAAAHGHQLLKQPALVAVQRGSLGAQRLCR